MVSDVEIFFQLKNHAGLVCVVMGRLKVVWSFLLVQGQFSWDVLCWAIVA
jgi:hypothetical protein